MLVGEQWHFGAIGCFVRSLYHRIQDQPREQLTVSLNQPVVPLFMHEGV
jgi:hypothetical protein